MKGHNAPFIFLATIFINFFWKDYKRHAWNINIVKKEYLKYLKNIFLYDFWSPIIGLTYISTNNF